MRYRTTTIAPRYQRKAKLLDALAVTLLLACMAGIGAATYLLVAPR